MHSLMQKNKCKSQTPAAMRQIWPCDWLFKWLTEASAITSCVPQELTGSTRAAVCELTSPGLPYKKVVNARRKI